MQSKSIYHQFLSKGYFALESGILSSIADGSYDQNKKGKQNMQQKHKEYEFKYTVEGTTFELKQKINGLDEIHNTDVIEWVERFQNLIKLTKWEDQAIISILKAVINIDLHD